MRPPNLRPLLSCDVDTHTRLQCPATCVNRFPQRVNVITAARYSTHASHVEAKSSGSWTIDVVIGSQHDNTARCLRAVMRDDIPEFVMKLLLPQVRTAKHRSNCCLFAELHRRPNDSRSMAVYLLPWIFCAGGGGETIGRFLLMGKISSPMGEIT